MLVYEAVLEVSEISWHDHTRSGKNFGEECLPQGVSATARRKVRASGMRTPQNGYMD